ncbi:MAG: hypothetical protein K2X77_09455 [Candidatus Obscuribacterales bacterium]|jgi:hypothetical protein|nr:hypothetical protein [Candidatus Obscuribacterales bacterium]
MTKRERSEIRQGAELSEATESAAKLSNKADGALQLSRRSLIASAIAALALGFEPLPAEAIGRKPKKPADPVNNGSARTIARQEWPPAITPEYVGIVDRGYACFADDMGRLAVVDLKREDNPLVIGELVGIGRKVVALSITQHRAFAVVQIDVNGDTQFQLVSVSLTPANDITVMSRIVLSNFSEPSCICSFGETIVVGGQGPNNENQIAIYGAGKRKVDPVQISVLTLERSPFKMDLQERQLLVLSGLESTTLDVISMTNPRVPEKVKSIRLDGSFPVIARNRDQVLVAGYGFDRRYKASLITLKPSPSVLRSVALPTVTELLDLAAQKGQFLILANQGSRQAVIPLILGRKLDLTLQEPVLLPSGSRGAAPRAHLAVKERDAYVASDAGGVQVLNVAKTGWQFSYSHTIPRLPASAVISEGNKVVIACAELKLYDLKDPQRPVLVESADLPSTVRAMLPVASSFLCLSRDTLALRSLAKPQELITSTKVAGNALAYDSSLKIAYLIAPNEKGTAVSSYKITEDTIKPAGQTQLPVPARKVFASNGRLLLAGLNELNLYKMDEEPQLIGSRKIPNLAIRDLVFAGDNIYASCVDENLKGYLVIMSAAKDDLGVQGACELPIDAASLAVTGKLAVVIGRGKTGKDMASLVSISSPAQPKVSETFNILESASALTIKDQMAIIAGRGIELINLS